MKSKVCEMFVYLLLFSTLCEARILSITPVSLSGKTHELCEFRVNVDSNHGLNPFRQAEMAIGAEFTLPSGKIMHVPAFYSRDYTLTNHHCVIVPGSASWFVRFSASEVGKYRFKVTLWEKGHLSSEKDGPPFIIDQSAGHGMIRIAKKAPRYLEFEDGESFFPIGQNVCWTTDVSKDIDSNLKSPNLDWDVAFPRWFGRMSQKSANWARLFMKPNFYLERGKPWEWSLENAWRLDYVLELAKQNGIFLCLCMNAERDWTSAGPPKYILSFNNSPFGSLLASRGLSCRNFTTDSFCTEMYRDKLRYIVARWGYSPNIACWEIWNEIECLKANDPVKWSKEMTAYLRALDPWKHLIKSSSHRNTPAYWGEDCGDLNDMHPYYGWSGITQTRNLGSFLPSFSTAVYARGRPFIIGECGIARECENGNCGRDADQDRMAFHIHECLWGGLFSGGAGTGMPWWWDEHVDLTNAYWRFQAIANYVKGVRFNEENFSRGTDATATNSLKVFELIGKRTRLVWVRHPDLSWYGVAVEKMALAPIKHATLSLINLVPGHYMVEIWNSERGRLLSRSATKISDANLPLVIALPDITTELAMKLIFERIIYKSL